MKFLFGILVSLVLVSCGGTPTTSSNTPTTNGTIVDSGGTMSGLPSGYYVATATPIQSFGVGSFTLGNSGYCETQENGNVWQVDQGGLQPYSIKDSVLTLIPYGTDTTQLVRLGSGQGIQGIWNFKDSTGSTLSMRWFTQDSMFILLSASFSQEQFAEYIGTGSTAQLAADGSVSAPYQGSTIRETATPIVSQGHFVGVNVTTSWGSKTCTGQSSSFTADKSAANCAAAWVADSAYASCVKNLVPSHPNATFCPLNIPRKAICSWDCVNMANISCQ